VIGDHDQAADDLGELFTGDLARSLGRPVPGQVITRRS